MAVSLLKTAIKNYNNTPKKNIVYYYHYHYKKYILFSYQ